MKKSGVLAIIMVILFSLNLFSDNSVISDEIISAIDNMQPVKYENVTIKGNLKFIDVQEKKVVSSSGSESTEYHCFVQVPVVFVDCIFAGDVVAYFNDEIKDEMYAAIFDEEVIFRNCTFERDALFKYSEFHQDTDFTNNKFDGEALFKYSKFDTSVSFENCSFYEDANFKYTKFRQTSFFGNSVFFDLANFKYTKFEDLADFSMVTFKDEADFKYTKFPEGVTFENARFNNYANFKYVHFYEPFNMTGTEFKGNTDFKYTKLEDQDFSGKLSDDSGAY